MGQLTRNNSQFEPAPEGLHQAVLADVVDYGWETKDFGNGPEWTNNIGLVWQIAAVRDDGSRYLVFGKRGKPSVDERSNLYKTLVMWMGKKAIEAAVEGGTFDTEDLVGKNARLQVAHEVGKDGITRAVPIAVLPWSDKDGPAMVAEGYVRRHLKADYSPPAISAFAPKPSVAAGSLAAVPGVAGKHTVAEVTPPASTDPTQLNALLTAGMQLFGAGCMKELERLAGEVSGKRRTLYDLTGTEASSLLAQLRAYSPAAALNVRMDAAETDPKAHQQAAEHLAEPDDSVFDDQVVSAPVTAAAPPVAAAAFVAPGW